MSHLSQALRRAARPAIFAAALVALAPALNAQPKPSPAAVAEAQKLITLTGAANLFTPLIAGVVEQAKLLFLQQNPALGKDLNEVAAKLRTDLTPRFSELSNEMATFYATEFTEPELKEIVIVLSVAGRQEAARSATDRHRSQHEIRARLGQQAVRRSDRQDARGNEEEGPSAMSGDRTRVMRALAADG